MVVCPSVCISLSLSLVVQAIERDALAIHPSLTNVLTTCAHIRVYACLMPTPWALAIIQPSLTSLLIKINCESEICAQLILTVLSLSFGYTAFTNMVM